MASENSSSPALHLTAAVQNNSNNNGENIDNNKDNDKTAEAAGGNRLVTSTWATSSKLVDF